MEDYKQLSRQKQGYKLDSPRETLETAKCTKMV